jgi:hypothetical protein
MPLAHFDQLLDPLVITGFVEITTKPRLCLAITQIYAQLLRQPLFPAFTLVVFVGWPRLCGFDPSFFFCIIAHPFLLKESGMKRKHCVRVKIPQHRLRNDARCGMRRIVAFRVPSGTS